MFSIYQLMSRLGRTLLNMQAGGLRSTLKQDTNHYRIQGLCRVSRTLGKAPITLGKDFAECNTRQRVLGKDVFAECQKALGKEKHSAKCKSKKNPKDEIGKKIIRGGMHS
jgi:hypothetical protein